VTAHLPETEYAARREKLAERMQEQGIDALFVPPSSDLEYLTGLERDLPSFGQSSYAHGWVTGAFIVPGREPLYVLPRMFVLFHLWGNEPDELITVNETDDGRALFRKATSALGDVKTVGIGARHLRRGGARAAGCVARHEPREWNAARERAPARQVPARARADDGRGPHVRRSNDSECRQGRAWRHDGGARRRGRAPDAHPRVAHAVVPDAHLQLRLRELARLDDGQRPRADRGGRGGDVRLRSRPRRVLLRLRPHDRLRRASPGVRVRLRRDARGPGSRTRSRSAGRRSRARSTPPAARR